MKSIKSDRFKDQKVIGVFEKVSFPEFSMHDITAKIDTGAYSGALHCTKIREEVTDEGPVLHFSPFDQPSVIKTTKEFYVRPVTSSNGTTEQRYFIDTEIVLGGDTYPILISLADRTELKWPVLIGRRFMQSNNLLVDANRRNK